MPEKKLDGGSYAEEIVRIFKLGRLGRKILAEKIELLKLRELEQNEFIDFLKLWITTWKKKK
jgi:hypothetical protein